MKFKIVGNYNKIEEKREKKEVYKLPF